MTGRRGRIRKYLIYNVRVKTVNWILQNKGKVKVHPFTGTEDLYGLYGP